MFRRFISAVALAAVVAAPAKADNFWFHNAGSSNTSYDRYMGSWDGPWATHQESFFQIFCVHPDQTINNGGPYNYVTTPFNSLQGNAINPDASKYINAAKLASLMVYPGHAYSAAQVISIQHAIWTAMGFSGYDNGSQDNMNSWLGVYASTGLSINTNNWLVLTSVPGDKYQEFITFVDTPYETVPEPATMTLLATGLAGMAAARRRRNSKS